MHLRAWRALSSLHVEACSIEGDQGKAVAQLAQAASTGLQCAGLRMASHCRFCHVPCAAAHVSPRFVDSKAAFQVLDRRKLAPRALLSAQ